MHHETAGSWQHDHSFGNEREQRGERRTWWVIGLTFVMMTVEIAAGMVFGSMALLADGWHMGTHAAALGITVFAYTYARRHANNERFTFGTGKVGALGGFGSAVALGVVAALILVESVARLASPTPIQFNEAIGVAVVGLVVNLLSAFILRDDDHHHHPGGEHAHHHHDHNLRGAYLHVLADALTSVLAIIALIAGKHLDWIWMDAIVGVLGSIVIARWSIGLLRDTGAVLLDAEVPLERRESIKKALESDADNRVADLHVWRVGRHHLAAILSVVTHEPKDPGYYKALLAGQHDLAHITVEVHRCPGDSCDPTKSD